MVNKILLLQLCLALLSNLCFVKLTATASHLLSGCICSFRFVPGIFVLICIDLLIGEEHTLTFPFLFSGPKLFNKRFFFNLLYQIQAHTNVKTNNVLVH